DSDVDAVHPLPLLVEDGVDRNSRLTGLTVTDDQLTLTATDGDHRVDGEDTRLHRAVYITAFNHAGGNALDVVERIGLDRALAVEWVTERVDDAANQAHTDRHRGDTAQRANFVAFLNGAVIAHDDDTDIVRFEVEGDTRGTIAE